jgi:fructoselysine-6-P-deglycase FrlB-like protein
MHGRPKEQQRSHEIESTALWGDVRQIGRAVADTLARTAEHDDVAGFLAESAVRRLVISGNGASYYVGMAVWLASLTGRAMPEVVAIPAGLLSPRTFDWREGDRLLIVSSSGELRDLNEARTDLPIGRYAIITANPGSSLGQDATAHALLAIPGQRSMTHTQSYCAALAAGLSIWARMAHDDGLLQDVRTCALSMEATIDAAVRWIEELGLVSAPTEATVFGSGGGWAAALEAALLLKEVAGVPAEGVETREGATSAMFALTSSSLAVSVGHDEDPRLVAAEESCAGRGASVVRLPDTADHITSALSSFPFAVALAIKIAVLAGRDPDQPAWTDAYLAAVRSEAGGGRPS